MGEGWGRGRGVGVIEGGHEVGRVVIGMFGELVERGGGGEGHLVVDGEGGGGWFVEDDYVMVGGEDEGDELGAGEGGADKEGARRLQSNLLGQPEETRPVRDVHSHQAD